MRFPPPDQPAPRWLWIVTFAGAGVIAAITLAGALLLRLGAADPPVAGPVIWEQAGLGWAGGPVMALDPGGSAWFPAPDEAALPGGAFTLDVRARLDGESDPGAAWGVWLETIDGARVIYAASGEGYITTRTCPPGHTGPIDACPALRPDWRWMPYPRVNPPGQRNTITLHQEPSGAIRLRLNGEILGAAPVERSGRWGVWVRGGRSARADIIWEGASRRG